MRLTLLNGFLVVVFSLSFSPIETHGQEKAGTTLLKAFGSMFKGKEKCCDNPTEPLRMPQNSLASPSNGVTPTGGQLQPFGQPGYRSGVATGDDDGLGTLPPLPDLRFPDQITKVEKRRNAKNAKYAARQAGSEARAEERRLADLETKEVISQGPLNRKFEEPVSPSHGTRPGLVSGGYLKPFNADSSYTEGCETKFKWTDHQFVEPDSSPGEGELWTLPPLPDLRTPDQISKVDKRRTRRVDKYKDAQARQAQLRLDADVRAEEKKSVLPGWPGWKSNNSH
jgi:hypothetical protein